jgi:pyruvate formate-lyase/glycerol dehydratase family glycyl radical enzyme
MDKLFTGPFLANLVLDADSSGARRIRRIRAALLESGVPKLSIARARIVTQTYRLSQGEPPVIRKAKAFAAVMENIPIPMVPDQLLLGTPSAALGTVEVDPEYYAGWLLEEVPGKNVSQLRYLSQRQHARVVCAEEDLNELEEDILPYWRTRHVGAFIWNDLHGIYPEAAQYLCKAKVFMANFGKGFSHTIQDYLSVVKHGLKGLKAEISRDLEGLAVGLASQRDISRLHHYRAMLICADGLIAYAKRGAALCLEEALRADEPRRAELEEMARVCRKVPESPAESWWEALQAIQFCHMATYLADGGVSHSFGRMDQYLYPFYRKWVEGDLDREQQAQELLECFFLKTYEYQSLRDARVARGLAGDRTNDKITLGGTDEYGEDVSNPLSYRFLEAQAHVRLKEPNLSVRIHPGTPERFMQSVLEVIRLGGGLPQLINDEVIVDALVAQGKVALADARYYADIGCQENTIDPNSRPGADANGHNNAGFFNLPKVLELTLHRGVNPVNGCQIGPETGDPSGFHTAESFKEALREQLRYAVKMNTRMNHLVEYHFAHTMPNPYLNLMHPGPRKTGVDYVAGGCKYNWIGAVGVGLATFADSAMVIEELIYRQKYCSWPEMLAALHHNWQGYDDLRAKSLSLPRYGGGGRLAESWARWLVGQFCDAYEGQAVLRGKETGRFTVGLFSMGIYLVLGEDILATPDGRLAGEMLSGSTAPSCYAASLGFTASHNATASLDSRRLANGMIFNQVMPINLVRTPRDLQKWQDLIKTFFARGGMSVQYSVVNRDDLKAAQINPKKYQDLIVRVGGYSARFIELAQEIQDEFIARLN